jgi:hypothetical protein
LEKAWITHVNSTLQYPQLVRNFKCNGMDIRTEEN